MKEVAYAALVLAFIGLILMFASASYENDAYSYDCESSSYLVGNYGHDGADEKDECEFDKSSKLSSSFLFNDIGYALLIFSLVLMVGANRLQK